MHNFKDNNTFINHLQKPYLYKSFTKTIHFLQKQTHSHTQA